MKFEFEGRTYLLEFERRHKNVELLRKNAKRESVKVQVRSLHPYTTAKLIELEKFGSRIVIVTGVVGCLPTDPYSNANGRLYALKALSRTMRRMKINKKLTAAVWQAYFERGKENRPQVTEEEIPTKPIELPASSLEVLPGETLH